MRFATVIGAATLVAAFFGSVAMAQGIRASAAPAEVPPASYTAAQYVDSKGCVWVRAGSGGAVTWVPRVSRDRKQLCNATPSLAARPAAPAPVKPVMVKPAAQPAPKVVVHSPKPVMPTNPVAPVIVAAPKPAPQIVASPTPARTSACPNRSPLSQRYTNRGQHGPVRCGPQSGYGVGATGPVATRALAKGGKIATGVFEPVSAYPSVTPGYRPVWTDGRINPNRPKPAQPKTVHVLQWTDYAPYRLIDTTTGKDVTAAYPQLRYPYTDYALQQAHLRTARTTKSVSPRPAAPTPSAPAAKPVYTPLPPVAPATDPASPARMSSKTDPAGKVGVTIGKGHRYVQATVVTTAAERDVAMARLRKTGLPVQAGLLKSGGQTRHMVLVGPFGGAQDLARAVLRVRGSGYPAAKTR